ncbi:MAG: diaminopimelate epimerase [Bacteroidia bacterium]|nr:diaminopimelate epimerase [Bacteroidia bacterium]MCX7764103.1 diaminopimelate epimerase [Bacteroidia bacterium]MDW8057854.1 diaminopimelate epimerase [Bacteroidia bacterium]
MLRFQKLQATGNDFILLEENPALLSEHARRRLCDRHFGIGADGLIYVEAVQGECARKACFQMTYWNADGRVGTFCGNGARAAAWAAYQRQAYEKAILLAADGEHEVEVLQTAPPLIAVSLRLLKPPHHVERGYYFADTGSPHLLVPIASETIRELSVETIAPPLRWETLYDPKGVNVSFFAQIGSREWYLRTYERGVEAETLSCGTACVALAAVVGEEEVHISTRGGHLTVRRKSDSEYWLIGPVEVVFTGEYVGGLS